MHIRKLLSLKNNKATKRKGPGDIISIEKIWCSLISSRIYICIES